MPTCWRGRGQVSAGPGAGGRGQTAGRGEWGGAGRPTDRALSFSAPLQPGGALAGPRAWVLSLSDVAVASALVGTIGVDVGPRWSNDILAVEAKLAGILTESWGEVIVVVTRINVVQRCGGAARAHRAPFWSRRPRPAGCCRHGGRHGGGSSNA
jgi:biotin-(acetyl-CoA carboxylase) ligase